jgi:RNA polymerase sigma-70 factor (ECF subfamily)
MVTDEPSFEQLMAELRAGDQQAAERIAREYGRLIQIMVRARLSDHRLRRVFDSVDVCQSVMASFFLRTAAGQYDLQTPAQLVALLTAMARHKLRSRVRKLTARRRDIRQQVDDVNLDTVLDGRAHMPCRQVELRELLELFHASLSDDERLIVEMRRGGASWDEVALRADTTPEAARKRLNRATSRFLREFELERSAL